MMGEEAPTGWEKTVETETGRAALGLGVIQEDHTA